MKNKGQISLMSIVGWGVAIALAAVGSMTASNIRTDDKIEIVKEDVKTGQLEVSQRVATLEEAITTLKTDNQEIKRDIKSILQAVKPR